MVGWVVRRQRGPGVVGMKGSTGGRESGKEGLGVGRVG